MGLNRLRDVVFFSYEGIQPVVNTTPVPPPVAEAEGEEKQTADAVEIHAIYRDYFVRVKGERKQYSVLEVPTNNLQEAPGRLIQKYMVQCTSLFLSYT